jgi:hypothetical protein
MTPAEIITADCERHNVDPQKVMGVIAHFIQNKTGQILHSGNSVLFVRMISDENAELHIFTQDSPIAIAKSVPRFWNALKSMGVRRVYGKADNQEILQLLSKLGADIQEPDLDGYNWMAEV